MASVVPMRSCATPRASRHNGTMPSESATAWMVIRVMARRENVGDPRHRIDEQAALFPEVVVAEQRGVGLELLADEPHRLHRRRQAGFLGELARPGEREQD